MDDKVIALFKNYDMNRKEGERGRESLPQWLSFITGIRKIIGKELVSFLLHEL
jgi:hypothetical protein